MRWFSALLWIAMGLAALAGSAIGGSTAEAQTQEEDQPDPGEEDPAPKVPEKEVAVEPVAADEQIEKRLTRILSATGWFVDPKVRVDEGVVFLTGRVDTEQHKEWAGALAGKTQDVVAIVNRIEIAEKSMWDLTPAWNEVRHLAADTVRNSPLIGLGLLLLAATWFVAKWSSQGAALLFRGQIKTQLLQHVAARGVALVVALLGLYLVLKVSGLTRLAMTVVGGTGLIGLVIGFAFRDIAENFLASVLISMQHPFARGDLIEVAGHKGYVQSVNTRSSLLMTLDGNHVQIPNATIYKETIVNYTANPNTRFFFDIGIGYEDSLAKAQSIAAGVLQQHPAVVEDPEPLVLVEALGAATVTLRIYFWVNRVQYSPFKVRSAIIRLTKHAFEQSKISMPDEAREVVFPQGVPVRMVSKEPIDRKPPTSADQIAEEAESSAAEDDLSSEAADIAQQARDARSPESGADLLES